jgi:hypothetical protein
LIGAFMKIDTVGVVGHTIIAVGFAVLLGFGITRRDPGQIVPGIVGVTACCVLLYFIFRGYHFGGPFFRAYPPGSW